MQGGHGVLRNIDHTHTEQPNIDQFLFFQLIWLKQNIDH